jgi:hypothetical protein
MIAGRFHFKRRRKLETSYGLTGDRALVAVGGRSLADTPVRYTPTSVRRARDGRHVTVTFGQSGSGVGRMYGNTGLEVLPFWASNEVAFYDVADVDDLLGAPGRIQRGDDR